jgi:hypothetical protein
VHLKSHHGKFLCAEQSGKVVADRADCREWETWTMRTTNGKTTFQSHHGKYLCAEVPPNPLLPLHSLDHGPDAPFSHWLVRGDRFSVFLDFN